MDQSINTGKQLKEYHKKKIIYHLAIYKSGSRADLAQSLNLSKMSISMLVKELMEQGLVEEKQEEYPSNIVGPKPHTIQITDGQIVSLAIFLSSEYIYAKLIDLNGKIHYDTKRIILKSDNREELIKKAIEIVEDVKTVGNHLFDSIIGAAISTESNTKMTGEEMKQLLEHHYSFFIHTLNQVQMNAFAECYDGSTYKKKKGIYINMEEEVSGALIKGRHHIYSDEPELIELAHMSIKFDGPFCFCGNRGCFQSYVCKSKLLFDSNCSSVDELCNSLTRRVPSSVRAIEGFIQACDVGFSNIINLLKPEYIILDGYVTKLDRLYLKQIETMINSRFMKEHKLFIKISPSKLCLQQQIHGLAISVFERYYFNQKRRLPQ